MSNYPFQSGQPIDLDYQSSAGSTTMVRFFNAVYAWMAVGLATTAMVAWFVSGQPQLMQSILRGPAIIVLFLAEIGLVIAISSAINRINATVATALFVLYSALNGLTFSVLFLVYAHASLASAFMVTGGTFAAISVYGFVTKTDLTRLGSFLFMALIGLVIASIVNIFMHSSALYWITTYAGVLIFVGLTAYDTQKLKMLAIQTENNPALASRLSVNGALMLYLDFINLFLFILRIMGSRRD